MPWYVYAWIGWNIFTLSVYLAYAADGKSIRLTFSGWFFALVIMLLETWVLLHLALHAH